MNTRLGVPVGITAAALSIAVSVLTSGVTLANSEALGSGGNGGAAVPSAAITAAAGGTSARPGRITPGPPIAGGGADSPPTTGDAGRAEGAAGTAGVVATLGTAGGAAGVGTGGRPASGSAAAGAAGAAGLCSVPCARDLPEFSDERRRMAVELGVEGASAPREGASSDTEWGVSAAVSFEIPLASGVFLGPRIGVASRLYGESLDVIDVTLAALPMTRWLGRKWPVGVRIAPGVGYVSSYNGEPDQLVPLLSVGPLLEYQPFVRGSYEDLRSAAELDALAREAALCESWKTLAWTRTEASQGLAGEINARIARCEKIPSPAEAASALRRVQAQLLARQPGAGLGIRIGGQYTLRLSDPDPSWSLGFFGGLVF